MALSDRQIRTLKPQKRPAGHGDGGGLHRLVTPQGSKRRRQAYRFDGQQKTSALGGYPPTSLSDARQERDKAKKAFGGRH